ncbi:hypothetical protein Aple_038150 [Acrocarpospora pleiomorpha]|uniref:Uncharacterized protein n=1 Tax=Acrocarpospora pleiomorpha TaxID=90975 RepID=A0A5M3XL75_9ACTN|nr:hypothetical protein Aple_038150 [Acrocarpospora pleiomorpha]
MEDGRRGSAIGWGGQPFCFPVQGLDEDEFQMELGVDKAVQDVHSGLPDNHDAPSVT